MRRTKWISAIGFATAGVLALSSAQAEPRKVRETKESPLSFRLASTTPVAGYEKVTLTTDKSTMYVSARPLWTGSEVVSAQAREGAGLEITLSPDAAKRLAHVESNDRLAVYIDGALTSVGQVATSNGRVTILGLDTAHTERVVKLLNGVRPVPTPTPSPTAAVIYAVPAGTQDGLYLVDVFVQGVTGMRIYQAGLTVSGGTAGSLTQEDVEVDESRDDYVFAGLDVVAAADKAGGRITGVLTSGAIDRAEPGYLGTYAFRPTSEAAGVFQVAIDLGSKTFLTNAASDMLEYRAGSPATIVIGPTLPRRPVDR